MYYTIKLKGDAVNTKLFFVLADQSPEIRCSALSILSIVAEYNGTTLLKYIQQLYTYVHTLFALETDVKCKRGKGKCTLIHSY